MKPTVRECVVALSKAHGPLAAHEIAYYVSTQYGYSYDLVRNRVYKMHRDRQLRISRYVRRPEGVPGDYIALFRPVPGRDAKRPYPQTPADISKRYWAKHGAARNLARRTADLGIWKGLIA